MSKKNHRDDHQMPAPQPGWLASLGHDLMASIVVFLVALPLCLGIAIASGAPPAAGLITGIIGGIVVGCLAGSPLQVSGPAAGLAVITYDLIQRHGMAGLGIIVIVAGLTQFAAGCFRLGQWFRAVSPAVIHGMLAGIGILIFASQFHVMVDDAPRSGGPSQLLGGLPVSGGLNNVLSIPQAIWKGILPLDGSRHHLAATVGLVTILTIAGWKLLAPKKLRFVPAPLVAVAVGTLAAAVWSLDVKYVPVPDNLAEAIQWPTRQAWQQALAGPLVLAGIAMALVASAETLLCAAAVDQMHHGPRTRYDRELAAQGIGNMLCGLLGGLPMTGVIVRSTANVEAGGRTRLSAILHGAWLLVLVALLPTYLRWIPTASLAAVLVFTGYKLINPQAVRELRKYGRSEVAIYAVTAGAIVVTDLLTGVLTGIALSAAKLLYNFAHLEVHMEALPDKRQTVLHLRGSATFIGLPKLAAALEQVDPHTELHAHLEDLTYIDHACLDLLANWERRHASTGGKLVIDWLDLSYKFNGNGNRARARRRDDTGGRSADRGRPAPDELAAS